MPLTPLLNLKKEVHSSLFVSLSLVKRSESLIGRHSYLVRKQINKHNFKNG